MSSLVLLNDSEWIRVEAGVYELANDRSIFIIHWSKMHPEPPECREDTWEIYQHEDGSNHWLESARTLSQLKSWRANV